MKLLVIEQPITDLFNVEGIRELDKRIETCDWVAAYETTRCLIAKLCSYRDGGRWIVGFKYVNSISHHHNKELYFQGPTHIEAIKNAIKEERKVMLFNTEKEFFNHFKRKLG